MLTIFRTNQLLANIFLLPYVVLLHLHLFIFPENLPGTYQSGFLSTWVFEWLAPNNTWANIFSILLLFVQGVMINSMIINNRMSRKINLFPGLFYVLLASSIPEFLHLSPLLLANTFYILSLSALLNVYKIPVAASRILNAGIWIGVASLFYFSYISLIFVGFIGLNILRAFKVKERLMFLSGVFIPIFLFGVYFFWKDQLPVFLTEQFYFRLNWGELFSAIEGLDYLKIGFFALLMIIAFLSYSQYRFKQNIKVQKKLNILFWALFFFFLSLAFAPYVGLINLLFLTVPLGILISFNFTDMKSGNAEAIHIILFFSILFLQYKSWFIVG